MVLQPICEAAKPLTHSAPGVTWWLGLNAAEQGAWIGGVGSVVAGVGALVAALIALRIAKRESVERKEARAADRSAEAYVLAAFILADVETIRLMALAAAEGIPKAEDSKGTTLEKCQIMMAHLNAMDASRIVANLPRLANFPENIAGALATAPTIVEAMQTLSQSDVAKWSRGEITVGKLIESLERRSRQLHLLAGSMDEFLKVYRPAFVIRPNEPAAQKANVE